MLQMTKPDNDEDQSPSPKTPKRFSSKNKGDDKKKHKGNSFQTHAQNMLIWGGFLSASCVIYYYLSSGHISFLLTYASFMRCFGFALMNFKMWSTHSAKGLSVKTMQLYALAFIFRLFSIMSHQGYLPFDKTGDWFYHVIEMMSLCFCGLAIFGMIGPLSLTYDAKLDVFGSLPPIPSMFGSFYILIPCVVLAAVFHPALNKEFLTDTCWAASMYVEAMAMLPQIVMFSKQAQAKEGSVDTLIGHTIFALGFSRIFELVFWLCSFKELAGHTGGSTLPGYIVLMSQFVHIIIMADFFYFYFKSLSKGTPMQIPQSPRYIMSERV